MGATGCRILFAVTGSRAAGMGHIKRCLCLAESFAERGAEIQFLAFADNEAGAQLRAGGFDCEIATPGREPDELTAEHARHTRPAAVVLDIIRSRDEHVRAMQATGCVVAALDDLGTGTESLDAHFGVDAAVVQPPRNGRLFAGPRNVIIPRQLLPHRPDDNECAAPRPELFMGFGGSDARGMTIPAVRAMSAWDAPFHASVVLGPLVADPEAVETACTADSRFTVFRDPPDLYRIMAGASLAVCSVGQSMFELACLGVPSLVVSLTELHARMADNFAACGGIEHLGLHDTFAEAKLADRISATLNDPEQWRAMRAAGLRAVDGAGARRICDVILELAGFL
jgi:spore coat polysaccharide biosynthesis predicted glycosyltransferase SpsG